MANAELEYIQLNLGKFPAGIADGLDMYADQMDLSRAQLVRRILANWLSVRLATEVPPIVDVKEQND